MIRRGEDEDSAWFEALIKGLNEAARVVEMLDHFEADNGVERFVEDTDDVFVDAGELEGDFGKESAGDLDAGLGEIHAGDIVFASLGEFATEGAVAAAGIKDSAFGDESLDLLEYRPPDILVDVGREWGLKVGFEVLVSSLGNQSAKPFLVGENLLGLGCGLNTGSSEMELIRRFAVLHVPLPPCRPHHPRGVMTGHVSRSRRIDW